MYTRTQKNKVMKKQYEFAAVESLSMENSFAVLRAQDDIRLNVTVGINSDEYGWFEVYDEETSGDEWYADGGLWFDGKLVTDYDGVFALPRCVVEKLKELGYDTKEVE